MSESKSHPTLSIGLPIYNGEDYMRESIDSILNQTFTDFELIISDNASTDATQEICEAYVKQDPRVRYYRNDENMGVTWNFNRVFDLATGEYYKWIGHDDIHDHTYLEKCLNALREREKDGYVLCWPNSTMIKENGDFDWHMKEPPLRVESDKTHERFRDGTYIHHTSFAFYGVMRSDVLRDTCRLGQWMGSDYTMIGQMALRGKLYLHPEYLFKRRYHPKNSYETCDQDYYKYAQFWVSKSKKDKILFPYWRISWETAKGVMRAPIPLTEKLRCLFYVATSRNRLRGRSQYLKDILYAFKLWRRRFSKSKHPQPETAQKTETP
ncbi:MAG: glycosyltransferase family 2 protein [Verrucomicrobiae bacterium]|nr:glycosyltransferase family 2 protein [Verrucomicrobiae bacterium]